MDFVHDADELPGTANISHAPAGHGKRLAETVDGQRIGPHTRQRCKAHVLPAIGQLGINLIADNQQFPLPDYLGQFLQFFTAHDRTGGIVGIGQNQRLGPRGDCFPDTLRRKAEVRVLPGFHAHGRTAGKNHAGAIAHIAGFRHQHLVPVGDQRPQRHVDGFTGANRHQNLLLGIVGDLVAPLQVAADLLPKGQ